MGAHHVAKKSSRTANDFVFNLLPDNRKRSALLVVPSVWPFSIFDPSFVERSFVCGSWGHERPNSDDEGRHCTARRGETISACQRRKSLPEQILLFSKIFPRTNRRRDWIWMQENVQPWHLYSDAPTNHRWVKMNIHLMVLLKNQNS